LPAWAPRNGRGANASTGNVAALRNKSLRFSIVLPPFLILNLKLLRALFFTVLPSINERWHLRALRAADDKIAVHERKYRRSACVATRANTPSTTEPNARSACFDACGAGPGMGALRVAMDPAML
jgi:hypothetical protein